MVLLHLAFFGLVLLSIHPLPTLAPNTDWFSKATEDAWNENNLDVILESLPIPTADHDESHDVDPHGAGYGTLAYLRTEEPYRHHSAAKRLRYVDGRGIEAKDLPADRPTNVPDGIWAGRQVAVPPGPFLESMQQHARLANRGGSDLSTQAHAYPQIQDANTLQLTAGSYHHDSSAQPYSQAPWGQGRINEETWPGGSQTGVPAVDGRTSFQPLQFGRNNAAVQAMASQPGYHPRFLGQLKSWDELVYLAGNKESLDAYQTELIERINNLVTTSNLWTAIDGKRKPHTWKEMTPTDDFQAWMFEVLRLKYLRQASSFPSFRSKIQDLKVTSRIDNPKRNKNYVREMEKKANDEPMLDLEGFLGVPRAFPGDLTGQFAVGPIRFFVWQQYARSMGGRLFHVLARDTPKLPTEKMMYCIFDSPVVPVT